MFDFGALAAEERTRFLEAVAEVNEMEMKRVFLTLALDWIRTLVVPLKNGAHSVEDVGGAARDVERICQLLGADTATDRVMAGVPTRWSE